MKRWMIVVAFSILTIFLLSLTWQAAADDATPTPAPVADFYANVTTGVVPLTVQFTDASTGNATGWSWDFGDANASTLRDPVYVFSVPGLYTITLTATNDGGNNTTQKIGYINATAAPTPTPTPKPPTPTPTKKPSATPKVTATPKPTITPTPVPTTAVMPTVPPELWDEINRSFGTPEPTLPPETPSPQPTLVPLPPQEPSPTPVPSGHDPVPGILAFTGFNVIAGVMYLGASLLLGRK